MMHVKLGASLQLLKFDKMMMPLPTPKRKPERRSSTERSGLLDYSRRGDDGDGDGTEIKRHPGAGFTERAMPMPCTPKVPFETKRPAKAKTGSPGGTRMRWVCASNVYAQGHGLIRFDSRAARAVHAVLPAGAMNASINSDGFWLLPC
ncbi:hypothetical protein ABZP36_033325 [Zizania latifolia]